MPIERRPSRKEKVKKKLLVLPLALLIVALGLAACGGSSSSSSSSSSGDEASIETAIEESATSGEPSICTKFQTEALNKREYPEGNALKQCEEAAEEGETAAESVDISKVEVNGESATADVAVTGGAINGQSVEIALVKEGGDWKLNEFTAFTKYDGAALSEFLEGKLAEEEGITPALAKCVSEGVAGMSQEEAEAMVFEKNLEALEESAQGCE
jgi:hypothetical protein